MEISLLFSVILIFFMILCAAFFAGAETAITGVSRSHMQLLEKEGSRRAALVNKIRERKDRVIGAMLLGNTLVNILASAFATSVLINMFGEIGVFYATGGLTFLLLIFGEVMPKTYAIHHADRVALRVAPFLRIVIFVFAPITGTVTWIVRGIFRMFGVDISKVSRRSHMEVLRGAIELHEGPSEETQEQRAMLRSILDLFEIGVEDIMIHRRNILMLNGDQPIKNLIEDVLDSPYTRLPIWKDNQDNIVGVLHAKMLLKALNEAEGDADQIKLDEVIFEPWFIPETTSLYDQLQAFRERKEHFAMVVDEYGALEGIVTLEDILEEIVGEIDDEHDVTVPGVRRIQGGKYLIDGAVTIRDLNREFEWGLPDEQYSTLAGLLLYESRTIPEVGRSFMFDGFRFDVVRRHRNQITSIRVTPPKPEVAISDSALKKPPQRSAAAVPG